MNMISFAKFDKFDRQNGFFPVAEADEKTEDFSSILSNIFVALQTTQLPVKTDADQSLQDGIAGNKQAENNLFEPPVFEQNQVKPSNFEITSEVPTAPTLWAGGQGIRQRANEYKSELKTAQKITSQTNELFQAETDSVKENSRKLEFQTAQTNPLNIVIKPRFVDDKLTGFDLSPNEIHSILGTFDNFLKTSATKLNLVESEDRNSESNLDFISSKLNQTQNLWWNDQTKFDENPKIGLEAPQNSDFRENDLPDAENKTKNSEFDVSVKFDKLFETFSKGENNAETVQKNQLATAKIAEQINPHLLELAALADKKNEKQTLRMRLHPAELGTVEIKLEKNSSGTLNAYFKTETEGARSALSNNLEQLRDTLQNAGWQIGQMEITSGSFSSTADGHREAPSRQTEAVENNHFSRSSETPADLEQNNSKRLLSLLA